MRRVEDPWLLQRLEAEAAQGWPAPFWPQDDPRVRTQRLPERCRYGHDLAENVRFRLLRSRLIRRECRACSRVEPPAEHRARLRQKIAA